MNLTLGSGVAVGGRPKGAGRKARAFTFLQELGRLSHGTYTRDSLDPFGRPGMRCAVLFSIFSLALLSFVGWVRHDSQRSAMLDLDEAASDDELVLFIG
jgi:hypothetical protein